MRMFGDCDRCGHSVAYHAPLVGCLKCDCEEFVIRLAAWWKGLLQ